MAKKPDPENIVRVPKTKKDGSYKETSKGEIKTAKRVRLFLKDGSEKLLFDGHPKLGWTKLRKTGVSTLCVLVFAIISVIGVGAFYLLKTQKAVTDTGAGGSLTDIIAKKTPLQTDQYGRANVVIFGTSENDGDHGGASLADSILVFSVNPKTGQGNTISIPRDLSYKDKDVIADGMIKCDLGSIWKLNAAYYCGQQIAVADNPSISESEKTAAACSHMAKLAGDVLGIDIQYYVKMDWQGLIDIVNSIGGIDVKPWTETPDLGIYDVAVNLRISPEEVANGLHLDGETALSLSRARNDMGGYGLPNSNFDRERNQQIILNAVKAKALSVGTLANPQKLADLIEALGEHMSTNVQMSEVQSFATAMSVMKNAISLPLTGENADGETINLVTTGGSTLGSIVLPVAGEFDFEDIQEYIANAFSGRQKKKATETDGTDAAGFDESSSNTVGTGE